MKKINPSTSITQIFCLLLLALCFFITMAVGVSAADTDTDLHTHTWSYAASGPTITATCTAEGCEAVENDYITILPPTEASYDGTAHIIGVSGLIEGVDTPEAVYKKNGETLDSAPINAGTYTAEITLGDATASLDFTIEKATPFVTPPVPPRD